MASPSQQSWGYHPFSSQSYRGALPDLSSSPPRDMTPPSSPPGSPTPAYRRVASLSDPFSGSAKVPSLSHHPSFGKQYPHRKHPHPGSPKKRSGKKRSLPGSPEGPSHWNDDTKPSQERGRRVLGDGGSWTAAGPSAAQDVFKRFYDPTSSDEASSDDLREVHAPLPHQRGPLRPRVGLGLGTPFEGRTTPFARVSSYPDSPFSAYGSAFPRDSQPKVPSPGSQPPAQQRRRLGGSSPKKLTREAGSSGSSDGDGDETILPSWEMREERRSTSPELDWARVIHEAFDKVDTKIELSGRGIKRIHPVIADISKLVVLPPPPPEAPSSSQGHESSTRAGTPLLDTPRLVDGASATNSSSLRTPSFSSSGKARDADSVRSAVQLYLGQNLIDRLPSALFQAKNLRVLSLRANNLTELPPAIGELQNLRELSIGNNKLKWLPAELQKLSLQTFNWFPNPFLPIPTNGKLSLRTPSGQPPRALSKSTSARMNLMGPPALPASRAGRGGFMPRSRAFERSRSDAQVEELLAQGTHMMGVDPRGGLAAHPNSSGFSSRHAVSPDADDSDEEELIPRIPAQARVLGPSERHSEGLPTLRELCMSRLLGAAEPDSPSGSRRSGRQLMLLETYDNGALRDLRYDLDSEIVRKLEAARRSATDTWGDRPSLSGGMRKSHGGSWCSGAGLRSSGPDAEMNGADVEAELDEGDDASQNPWYGRCPNPRHGSGKPSELDWPVAVEEASRAPIFVTPAETRMEWVSHVAGCQVGPEVPRLLKRAQAQKVLLGAPQSFGASAQSSSQRASVSPAVEDETLLDSGGLLPILWKGCRPGCLDFLESGVAATRTGL